MLKGFTVVDKTVLGIIAIIVSVLLVALPLVANSGTRSPAIIYESYWDYVEFKESDLTGHSWEVTKIDQTYEMRDGTEQLVPVVELSRYKIDAGRTTLKYGGTTYSLAEFKKELLKGSFTN